MSIRRATRGATKTYKTMTRDVANVGNEVFFKPVTKAATRMIKPLHKVPLAGGIIRRAVSIPHKFYKGASSVVIAVPNAAGKVGGLTGDVIMRVLADPIRAVTSPAKKKSKPKAIKARSKSRR